MATDLKIIKHLLSKAKTTAQLNALIIDYTHQEILQAYHQLTFDQQMKVQKIWQGELKSNLY
ncbi:MAG: hypothetical protein AAFO04_21615 [Cyanobacteria bacterium J06592_8]